MAAEPIFTGVNEPSDKDGMYIMTGRSRMMNSNFCQKKRWLVLPEGTEITYVLYLNRVHDANPSNISEGLTT